MSSILISTPSPRYIVWLVRPPPHIVGEGGLGGEGV